jgi:hypothetical protein
MPSKTGVVFRSYSAVRFPDSESQTHSIAALQ